jgi:hypothetical protein
MKETLENITCAVKGIAATLLSVLGLLIVVQAVFGAAAPVNVIGNLEALLGGFVGAGAGFTSFVTLVLVVALVSKLGCDSGRCSKK